MRPRLNCRGRTIAVLGSGVERAYPPEHEKLYQRIAEQGAVISELPIGTRPMAFNFPARNRLISGLSLGVVVVEATEKSGSLITASLAVEQGREVFAVPGEVGSSRSRGAHRLIRQGAKLVETVDDIIEEIAPQLARLSGGAGKLTRGSCRKQQCGGAESFRPAARAFIADRRNDRKQRAGVRASARNSFGPGVAGIFAAIAGKSLYDRNLTRDCKRHQLPL